ncbi:GH18 family chitinase [Chitinophaga skermanii]|uniref:chitinase n=1 Tax=Chitinophaga skermanii TaxID=331697 RepID=A0A327R3J2_9BACT|nr:glycosyl hydrolase family 18 protein [Chitinophaga skermanii]RAJ08447.1 GH18 family chitinase [Chitinophaga skermanii]
MKRIIAILLLLISGQVVFGQSVVSGDKKPLRVLGYLLSDENWQTDVQQVDLTRITDICLAFLNPDSTGAFHTKPSLRSFVQQLKQQKIRTFISLGGADAPPYIAELTQPGNRQQFIRHIVDFASTYGFDGVDVDYEGEYVNSNYSDFILALGEALRAKQLLMTAALATYNSKFINDQAIQSFDFINIMAYDKTGPWNMKKPGPHSSYEAAVQDFEYYHVQRKVPAEKLYIGLPFYGYVFGETAARSMKYNQIIAQFPGAEYADEWPTADGTVYYNGKSTIKRKVQFAQSAGAGGVMIWELKQDSKNEHSLLQVIQQSK